MKKSKSPNPHDRFGGQLEKLLVVAAVTAALIMGVITVARTSSENLTGNANATLAVGGTTGPRQSRDVRLRPAVLQV